MTAHRDTELVPWGSERAGARALTIPLAVEMLELYCKSSGVAESLGDLVSKAEPRGQLRKLVGGDVDARLRASRALTELAALEQTRAALAAADQGRTQRQIAQLLNISQTEVHRSLRRARSATRNWQIENPREAILQYNAGMLSLGGLVGSLAEVVTYGKSDPAGSDGYIGGTWDEIRDAYMDGLLTDNEYDDIRLACASKSVAKGQANVRPDSEKEESGV